MGEQGSAKSTTQSVLRSLIDPNKVMLRGRPKTVEDVFVAAANNWLVSYENLSGLTPEQQGAFCTLPTGGGFASRQLYTNGEEHVMETKRPVVLNGIAVVATRPDLIDRVIHVDLPTIPADARRDDADTHAGWERDPPRVFAGLLDLFSAARAILPTVHLTQKQRMADYERPGEAAARFLAFAPGELQQQYAGLVRAGIDRGLESNAVAQALDKYIAERVLPINWQGTAGQLYDLLNTHSIPGPQQLAALAQGSVGSVTLHRPGLPRQGHRDQPSRPQPQRCHLAHRGNPQPQQTARHAARRYPHLCHRQRPLHRYRRR